jgi:asparagine synthase (glutamine-hydrolysing)
MYAFALWDSADESLLLARDPFGIKPLYYAETAGRFLFASEISSLVASGAVASEIDPSSLAEYLAWFAVPAPRTIYRNIDSLQPGHSLKLRAGKREDKVSWSFPVASCPAPEAGDRPGFVRQLREKLDDSIRAHVLADVPVGAFLSGGLDSAVIAGLMSKASGNVLKTFSIGFEEDDFSEADSAEATAKFLGSIHHTHILTGDEVAADIDRFLDACDQPTGDGVNTYYASKIAQEGGVKVALSGLGGDELFGGYPSFNQLPRLESNLRLWRRLPGAARSLATNAMARGGSRWQKLGDFLSHASDMHELGAMSRRVFSMRRQGSMLSGDALEAAIRNGPFHPQLGAIRAQLLGADSFSLISAWELRTYMADVLLRDSDVMSMRHSIELRVPFIDRPLIEWLWAQPSALKSDPKRPKSALQEAAQDVLPPELMGRKKRGFTLPFPIWMRMQLRPFIEDVLSPGSIARSGYFNGKPIRELWNRYLSGGNDAEWSRVWSMAILIAFVNRGKPVLAKAA